MFCVVADEIPGSFDDITPAWLTDALRSGGHLPTGSVRSIRRERIGEGSGFMGQISLLVVDYVGAAAETPSSFVVKMAADPGPNRDMGVNYRIYEKESRFYAELAPQVDLRTPTPYVNRFDPESHSFVLLLENLAPMQVGSELRYPDRRPGPSGGGRDGPLPRRLVGPRWHPHPRLDPAIV